jgi:hypothetical protein
MVTSGGRPSKARGGAAPEDSDGASYLGGGAREAAVWLGNGGGSRRYMVARFWSFMGSSGGIL